MGSNNRYGIDLWLFIASIIVLLYILIMNLMFVKNWSNEAFRSFMEWFTVPIVIIGSFIPLIVIFRYISKQTNSKALAALTMLFSLLTAIFMGYTTLEF